MSSLRLNLVVAACNNHGIGINGELPWRLKKDMAFFKKITSETTIAGRQNAVIMGRKTWFSIPEKFRPLKGRVNIVLSKELKEAPEGVYIARSLPDAINLISSGNLETEIENVHIIGGSSVYKEAMTGPYDCRLYLTRINKDFDCDTFLPPIDEATFKKVENPSNVPVETQEENDIAFKFEVYDKCATNKTQDRIPNAMAEQNSAFTFNIMAAMCHHSRGIGIESRLPWPSLSEDYKRYLRITSTPKRCDKSKDSKRKIIHIFGKATFLTVGDEEMSLPNVFNVVISKTLKEQNFSHPKVVKVVETFDEAINFCDSMCLSGELDSVWIMGGHSVYQAAIHHDRCNKLYLTHVYEDFPADAFFPIFEQYFDEIGDPECGSVEDKTSGIKYEFKVYKKKA